MRGSIVKRGLHSFACVVYLGRDPASGKERQKWISFRTRREAEAHLVELVGHVTSGAVLPPTKLCVGEYLERWLRDYAEGRLAAATLESYRATIRVHLLPGLGHIRLSRLSPQAIQGYLTRKLQEGLSTTTVRYHAAIVHEALRHAVKWGLLAHNPADRVELPRRRQIEMRVWDEEQVRLFLAEARRTSAYYALYLAALTTGMRQGELLGLRWQDVDLALGVASVQQTLYRLGKTLLTKEPKSAKSRRPVALPSLLVETLREVQEVQVAHRRDLGAAYADYGLIFCQPDGKPLHAHNVSQRDFRRVVKRAGVPRIRFHDLRHCHATLLLRQGVHPKVVQERLGHATISMTLDTYSHVVPGMQERAVTDLEKRLFGEAKLER
jgi:integrase